MAVPSRVIALVLLLTVATPASAAQVCGTTKVSQLWTFNMPSEVRFRYDPEIVGFSRSLCPSFTFRVVTSGVEESKAAFAMLLAALLGKNTVEICIDDPANAPCDVRWVNVRPN